MNKEKTIVRGLVVLMGLMGSVGLTNSCSNDEEPAKGQTEASEAPVAEVRSFATYFDEYVAKTRAWTPPSGYVAYEDGQPIGIAFTQNGQEAIKGTFYKNGDKWRLIVTDPTKSVEDIKAGTNYLYGYIPSTSGIILNVTDLEGKDGVGSGASYSTGAKVELNNVPTVMSEDLCVVIGAKDGTGKEAVTGLRRGDFAYNAKTVKGVGEDAMSNFVFLLFDHLYASLSINMEVDANYAALRTIKLKALKLKTKAGALTCDENAIITVGLEANSTGSDPITEVNYGVSYVQPGNDSEEDNDIEDVPSFWWSDDDDGVDLAPPYEGQPFTGYFMPDGITTLVLTSVYNVYDKEGNLTREKCSATNKLVISEIWRQTTAQRGKKYIVNMTIQPTYLYVLSEPDLDNPTVTVK